MIHGFNHSVLELKQKEADSVAVKGKEQPVQIYNFSQGKVEINTDNYAVGQYYMQFFKENQIIKTDVLNIEQNLKYVDSSFDPRSNAEKTLEAIIAMIEGRATSAQEQVRVGDKFIRYLSYDELIKWKNFFEQEVRKEQGKAGSIRFEKLYYKGI